MANAGKYDQACQDPYLQRSLLFGKNIVQYQDELQCSRAIELPWAPQGGEARAKTHPEF